MMSAPHEDWEKLHGLLTKRMNLDDLRWLCNIYLDVEYEDVRGDTRSAKVSDLIAQMARQNKINLLCHQIIKMRPDMEAAIVGLGYDINGVYSYMAIATNDILPHSDRENVLRDPRKIYLALNCASTPQHDSPGEDAIGYINRLHCEKPAVLLVGDYGTGKSFLTQKVFIEASKALESQIKARIPILLPLKQLVGLASRDKELALVKIVERLRMLRFFKESGRTQAEEKAEIEARLHAGEFLCILDGFDEIPLISMRLNPKEELASLIDSLVMGDNRIILTSRPGILPDLGAAEFAGNLPTLGVGYLLPWQGEETWWEYLRSCERLGIDFGPQGYYGFGKWVIARSELRQLTRTPLFCQMLVDTRNDISHVANFNLAKLYETYVSRYFENVSERSPIRLALAANLQEEIAYKENCLMATAVGMAKKNTLRLAKEEIDQALLQEAQQYGDELLAIFTRQDVLVYSLLVGDVDRKFSFSHKSFYDFFVAQKIYKELWTKQDKQEQDRFALLGKLLLSREIVAFLSGLYIFNNRLRAELQEAFEQPTPWQRLAVPGNKILLRNLALIQLELEQRLEGADLRDLNFSGYVLSSADQPKQLIRVNLDGSNLEGTDLTLASLRGSRLRAAKLNRCILDQADLRDTDLSGAELQDISCRDTRFLGADFTGAILRASDVKRIMLALHAEQVAFPDTVADSWIRITQRVLNKSVV